MKNDFLKGKRILIAEDDFVNQKLISHSMQSTGASFDIVGNGKEAIESLERCEGVQRPEQNVHYLSKGDTVEEIKEWTDGTEKNYLQSQTKDFQL